MHVRLGFAVAVHLDPDILVVDEVLAVGDASFRKRAVNKMQDLSKGEGRTVLFVSHNMESIKNLCASAIQLKQGQIINCGPTQEVIDTYQGDKTDDAKKYGGERTWKLDKATGNDVVRLMAIRTKNENGEACSDFEVTESFWLEVDYMVLKEGNPLGVTVEFQNSRNVVLFVVQDDYIYGAWGKQAPKKIGLNRASFHLPKDLLDTGTINVTVNIYRPPEPGNSYQLKALDIFSFNVSDSFSGLGARGNYPYHWGTTAVRPFIKCTSELVSSMIGETDSVFQ
jgi:lipopolysaccharide transport system ATP-binding protein